METRVALGSVLGLGCFKSHHSGMETGETILELVTEVVSALNRTIVGWKHNRKGSQPLQEPALNRTIVGWKPGTPTRFGATQNTLNRTIVGWKHKPPLWPTRSSTCFKSHHSGMETRLYRVRLGGYVML